MSPIEKAVEAAGGQKALAEAIGVAPSFVNQLVKGVRPIPATLCKKIVQAVDGAVSCADLRPDVFDEVAA